MDLPAKSELLAAALERLGSVLVAYSGGTDSAFLAWSAHRVLGDRMLAVIADSASLPRAELAAALAFTAEHGIPTQILQTAELDNPQYQRNDSRRCFHCKDELFTRMEALRESLGFRHIAYGMNLDDRAPSVARFRPGQQAAMEHNAVAPLVEAGLTKPEIRALARAAGLSLADKPASACLASRIQYGRAVTRENLSQVEQAEDALHALGFAQVRVRHHGDLARVEIDPADLPRALSLPFLDRIITAVTQFGFPRVTIDPEGYRSGSMNDLLPAYAIHAASNSERKKEPMRIAYLDCFAGISGDMFLGALIDAGVDPQILHDAAAAMNLGASLKIEKVDRSGISSTKVHVLEGTRLAETAPHSHPQQQVPPAPRSHHPQTQHLHNTGHAHTHEEPTHNHSHGRSLTVIRELIRDSKLAPPVIHTAIRAFELLGASEAKIHNIPVDQIHFHEVGAVDAIIDIVAASAGIHALGADRWVASPLNVGGGMVDCAHGRFPVPAPATADLLRGLPTYSANIQIELVTPTGAALIRALVEEKGLSFGPQPAMRVERIGYGAGTRNPKDFPNVLRLSVGNATELPTPTDVRVPHPSQSHRDGWDVERSHSHHHDTATEVRVPHPSQSYRDGWDVNSSNSPARDQHHSSQTVTVLETALDDLSPQLLAHVAETALQHGALDVMLTPVIMKKGRPGTLLTVLCNPSDRPRLEEFLLRETSTLGLRVREDRRVCLDRSFQTVETPYGPIRIKLGSLDGETINANPEFEDCRAASTSHGVAVKTVNQAAIAAYIAARYVEVAERKSSNG